MKKKLKAFIGFVAVLIIGAAISMPKMLESSIPSVFYITPNMKTYENTINCTGTVQAMNVQTVYVPSPIIAEKIYAEIGDRVKEGDLLASVDMEKTNTLSSQSLDTLKELSLEKVEQQTSGVDWAALASLYGMSTVVNGGTGTVDFGQLEDLLDSTNLTTQTTGIAVDTTISKNITAPISGIITDIGIREDVPVGGGKAIFTISDSKNYKVMAAVGEADIAKIKEGDKAKIRGVAFSGRVYNGTVTKIYPTARKMLSGTTTETVVDVEIALENPDSRLKSGFSAKVEIVGDQDFNLLTVPYEAIRQDDKNNEYVYVYQDGRIQKASVVTGRELTNEVQILSGLTMDSIVIFNPDNIIKEGGMISIKGRADVH